VAERQALAERLAEEIIEATRPERTPAPPPTTATAENGRLRGERREVWRMAEAATRYWRLRLEFEEAVSWAQRIEIPEGSFHRAVDPDFRRPMVEKYRAALARQLLTPAWDVASVKWKQTALAAGRHEHTSAKPERIERAIADDLVFLAAHPVRQSKRRATTRSAGADRPGSATGSGSPRTQGG
jgi:hypothetical protein